jgi:hypothetical protein
MTTDCETLARHYDLDLGDLPLIAPPPARHRDDSVIDLPAAVAALRSKGLSDDHARVALRSILRDVLRERPDTTDDGLEAMTSRFDRSIGRVLAHRN